MSTAHQNADATLLGIIFRRWKIAVVATIVLFALMVSVIAGLKPRYAAHTLLLLPSTPFTDLTQQAAQSTVPQTDPFIIRSYAEIILGDDLCRTVIRKLHLAQNPAFQPHPSRSHLLLEYIKSKLLGAKKAAPARFGKPQEDEDTALILYKKRLSAFNDGRSLTLDLAFELEDPQLATRIVNDHADAYTAAQIAYRYSQANIKVQWMKKQLDESAQQLHDAEVALQTHATPLNNSRFAADQTAELKSRKAFADAQESVYTNLLNRYNMMAAEKNYMGSDTRVVSRAEVPTHPKFPNTPLFVAIAAVVSVLGGCAAAWLSSLLNKVIDADDIAAELQTSFLGTVMLPSAGSLIGTSNARRLRRAMFWEQIRTVRSSLGVNVKDGSVILVTSYAADEGSSVMAASLARAVASSGTRTLLLDANMRRPSAHKLLDVVVENHGLLDRWRSDDRASTRMIVPVPGAPELSLFSPSLFGAHVDALAGSQLKSILEALRQQFKVVIIDTPPIGIVADALNVAELADSTIVVASVAKRPAERLRKVMALLATHGAHVRGFVFTRKGSPAPQGYAPVDGVLDNDRLADVLPIPSRRPAPPRMADAPHPIPEAL